MAQEKSSTKKLHPREKIITANWKMYKTSSEAREFIETLAPLVKKSQERSEALKVYLAVPFTAISACNEKIHSLNLPFHVGAQNMNDASEGAFTGEIAAKMLKEAGAQFVILGHSERRKLFLEINAFINRKIKRALLEEIQPVLCIGEQLEERERGETETVLTTQLMESLEGLTKEELSQVILAYEPVWAIGTGLVASPSEAEAAHLFCRNLIEKQWGEKAASQLVIQYGGSVKPEYTADLMAQKNIDGLLVGGASLSAMSFSQIINYSSV